MVRDTKTLDELIETTRDINRSRKERRAQRRPFVYGSTAIVNPGVTRDIVARAAADFERIFGSE